jgi:DNA-binding MarR family transcriptional regulator
MHMDYDKHLGTGTLTGERQPIGYWLKHLDALIESSFDEVLAVDHLSRRGWQVLNTVARGPLSTADLADALAPFLSGEPDAITPTVTELLERGWLARDTTGRLDLTVAGRHACRQIRDRVHTMRATAARGVSREEYRGVIDVLGRMSANLETPPAARDHVPTAGSTRSTGGRA